MKSSVSREEELKRIYKLGRHPEGGYFSEAYTAPYSVGERPISGSIYFLLGKGGVSRLHEIDCDEIWYYHEGCGMKITALDKDEKKVFLLGMRAELGEAAMVAIPAGTVFAAENISPDGYTFVSCVTTPKFEQSGFRVVDRDALEKRFPEFADECVYLAF
ncbi:MAG: cupin domain-containing protein [Clostridia bacterium]|nr:cupin domain-containing protein [Clostridia bacterium]